MSESDTDAVVVSSQPEQANAQALERLYDAEPVLVDVRPAGEVVPGLRPNVVLASGAPMPWERYTGGQRLGVLGGAVFEGLARDVEDADRKLHRGEILVGACQDHGCIGSLAGIYTASMPVCVVENTAHGNTAFCNFVGGPSPKRLDYGVWDDEVRESLLVIRDMVAPVVAEAVRRSDHGVPLRPVIRHALSTGVELRGRNSAGTLLFARDMFPLLLDVAEQLPTEVRHTYSFLAEGADVFSRLSMAASKATADAIRDIEGSSIVSAMTSSCREFAIRVSGLGDQWFTGRLPQIEPKLFDGYTPGDIEWIGSESIINETVGLGGFARAAAFTLGEHPDYQIPSLGLRGVPIGIDVLKVVETGVTPVGDIWVTGRGGHIGAGILHAPMECFQAAAVAWEERYDRGGTAPAADDGGGDDGN